MQVVSSITVFRSFLSLVHPPSSIAMSGSICGRKKKKKEKGTHQVDGEEKHEREKWHNKLGESPSSLF